MFSLSTPSCCLICWNSNTPQVLLHPYTNNLSSTILHLLKIDQPPPSLVHFCANCNCIIQQILIVKDKLDNLQLELDNGIKQLKKIAAGAGNYSSGVDIDPTFISFRTQLLGDYVAPPQKETRTRHIVNSQPQPQPTDYVAVNVNNLGFDGRPSSLSLQSHIGAQYAPATATTTFSDYDSTSLNLGYQDGNSYDGSSTSSVYNRNEEMVSKSVSAKLLKSTAKSMKRKRGSKEDGDGNATPTPRRNAVVKDHFSKVVASPHGTFFYEGFEFLKLQSGYQCKTCGWCEKNNGTRPWLRERCMKIHIKGSHLDGYRCNICDKSFKSWAILRTHNEGAHVEIGCKVAGARVGCKICGKPVTRSNIKQHEWSHMNRDEKNAAESTPNNEAVPALRKLRGIYQCDTCRKAFTYPQSLKLHQDKHCGKLTSERNDRSECTICGRSVVSLHLEAHKWTHKNQEEKEEATALGQVPEKVVANKKTSQCPVCGKLVWYGYLKTHVETHKEDKVRNKIKCPVEGCNKEFNMNMSLRKHTARIHPTTEEYYGVKKFVCVECEKKFMERKELARHLVRVHRRPSERNIICDICNCGFVFNYQLQVHKKIHLVTPDEQFIICCQHCPARFHLEINRKTHCRLQHPTEYNIEKMMKVKGHRKPRPKQKQGSESSDSTDIGIDSSGDEYDESIVIRPLSSRRGKMMKGETIDFGSNVWSMPEISTSTSGSLPTIRLNRIPPVLMTATNVRVIRDDLLSYTSYDEEFKVSLSTSL